MRLGGRSRQLRERRRPDAKRRWARSDAAHCVGWARLDAPGDAAVRPVGPSVHQPHRVPVGSGSILRRSGQLGELRLHRRVALRELLHRERGRLVVREAQVPLRAEQGLLHLGRRLYGSRGRSARSSARVRCRSPRPRQSGVSATTALQIVQPRCHLDRESDILREKSQWMLFPDLLQTASGTTGLVRTEGSA